MKKKYLVSYVDNRTRKRKQEILSEMDLKNLYHESKKYKIDKYKEIDENQQSEFKDIK